MRLGILISNASQTQPTHSTVHIARAALEGGHQLRFIEPCDFEIDPDGRLRGRAWCFDAPLSQEDLAKTLTERSAPRRSIEVDRLDVLLLRVNPLSHAAHTFALLAQSAGVRVLNDPRSLPKTLNKAWLATLPAGLRPRTLVTCSKPAAERFLAGCLKGVVIKPARACGGKAVSFLPRHAAQSQLEAAFEVAIKVGDGYAILQEYIEEAALGEKRLLWLDGRLIGGYLRQRAPGELTHNLKTGGQPEAVRITDEDTLLTEQLSPYLKREGIWFAGIDVIGGRAIEINVLNPGGLHWSGYFLGVDLAWLLITSLESSEWRMKTQLFHVERQNQSSPT
jgi:glutathione synthase